MMTNVICQSNEYEVALSVLDLYFLINVVLTLLQKQGTLVVIPVWIKLSTVSLASESDPDS